MKELAFVLDLCYTVIMIEEVPIETAEEKAQRIWRNNLIARKIREYKNNPAAIVILDDHGQPDWDKILADGVKVKSVEILAQERAKDIEVKRIARDIVKYAKQIFETKRVDVLKYYAASIRAEKNRLLREKLRRLERDNAE